MTILCVCAVSFAIPSSDKNLLFRDGEGGILSNMILFTVPKIYLKVGNSKYGKCSRGILIRLERISGEFEKIRSFLLIC